MQSKHSPHQIGIRSAYVRPCLRYHACDVIPCRKYHVCDVIFVESSMCVTSVLDESIMCVTSFLAESTMCAKQFYSVPMHAYVNYQIQYSLLCVLFTINILLLILSLNITVSYNSA